MHDLVSSVQSSAEPARPSPPDPAQNRLDALKAGLREVCGKQLDFEQDGDLLRFSVDGEQVEVDVRTAAVSCPQNNDQQLLLSSVCNKISTTLAPI